MQLDELIKLANLLDENGEHTSASEVDQVILRVAQDEGAVIPPDTLQELQQHVSNMNANIKSTVEELQDTKEERDPSDLDVSSTAKLRPVFEKLSSVADKLDSAGALSAADMIDGFMNKYAAPDDDAAAEAMDRIEDKLIALNTDLHYLMQYLPEEVKDTVRDLQESVDKSLTAIDSFGADLPGMEGGMGEGVEEEMGEAAEEFKNLTSARKGKWAAVGNAGNIKTSQDGETWAENIPGVRPGDNIPKKAYDVVDFKESDRDEYDYKAHHNMQVREPKKDQERVDREGRGEHHVENYKSENVVSLQTRGCPDHVGAPMSRVSDGVWQCSLDGKMYNFNQTFEDNDGRVWGGGSIAGQTPDSSGYGVPKRVFDSRYNDINSLH